MTEVPVGLTFSRPDPFADEAVPPGIRASSPGAGYAETLEEMGTRLLDPLKAAALAKGITLPGRQAWYMAPIPADCEQAIALFSGWNPVPVQDSPTICQPWRWQAGWSVIITRCTPAIPGKGVSRGGIKSVSTEQLNAAGKLASDDAEVLLDVLNRIPGEIGSDVSVITNAPSGGYQTVELNVPLISGGSL